MLSPGIAADGCLQPIDVILQSSDGKQFGTHKSYLSRFSEGFPEEDGVRVEEKVEVVPLVEDADVILLMLKFMHPQRPPLSRDIPSDVWPRLAEAAEKYVVYSAMEVCRLKMECVFHLPSSYRGRLTSDSG